jgi:hypothetical protein
LSKRGRPANEPSDEEREKVKELVAVKTPVADIAKLLGRSLPTLRKYFPRELFSAKKIKPADDLKVTALMRAKVVRYIGCKMAAEQVARVLDITLEQLEAHFPDELVTGQAKCRAKIIDHLHDQMEEGVVGATNRLETLTALPEGGGGTAATGPGGKKAAAASAAKAAATAGGRFAPPSPPKLVVNNDS